MKFSHIADCHIGSWRDPKMTELNFLSFSYAIEQSIKENVDFVLIAGDLFNTSMPSIDYINKVVKELVKLKENKIPVYAIAGSHDFSPSGKTMLKVLESAGLLKNVLDADVVDNKLLLKVIEIPELKLQITGMLGKKGTLEKHYYDAIDYDYIKSQLKKDWFKIFMFHSAISEFKPEEMKDMPSQSVSVLPKGFDYYAGGHVHYRFKINEEGYGLIVYPGPTFPNNFKELEDLNYGSFVIVDESKVEERIIKIKDVVKLNLNLNEKTPSEAKEIILQKISELEKQKGLKDKILLFRLSGRLNGFVSDINFGEILNFIYDKKPFFVMKNSIRLESKTEKVQKINVNSIDELEQKIISENGENVGFVLTLLNALSSEKKEGETNIVYEDRIISDVLPLLKNHEF